MKRACENFLTNGNINSEPACGRQHVTPDSYRDEKQ